MTGTALIMLVISILLVWGGLLASLAFLRMRPEVTDGPGAVDPDDDSDDNPSYRGE